MKAIELYQDIRKFFEANADKARAKKYSRYFKEGYDAYGITPDLMHEKRDVRLNAGNVSIKTVLGASKYLVGSGKFEETTFAVILLKGFADQFDIDTFKRISKWFDIGIINWGHCDVFCGHLMSILLNKNIISYEALADWRTGKNKYQRRAVPVSLLEIKDTTKNFKQMFKFIEPLMMDQERTVGQGLGWYLREVWKIQPKVTEEFLLEWKDDAPRVIFQYATEKMSKEGKARFRKAKKKA